MRKTSYFCCVLVSIAWGLFGQADAQVVVWDQQPDPNINQIIDQDIPGGLNEFSTYLVNDVTFASDVRIDSVTSYYTNSTGVWPALVDRGVLNIFSGEPLDASDDPTSGGDFGGLVDVTVELLGNNVMTVTAHNLNIDLAAGDYWFGLTATEGEFQEFHFSAATRIGSQTLARNPAGGFGVGTDWFDTDILASDYLDSAMTITAVVPEPTSFAVCLVGMLGMTFRRRIT